MGQIARCRLTVERQLNDSEASVTVNNLAGSDRQLSNHERGFQDLESSTRTQVVSGVVFLSKHVSGPKIWKRLWEFTRVNPIYRSLIDDGRQIAWKTDTSFDLSNHLDEIVIERCTTEQVLTMLSNIASRGLPTNQPPWRILVLRLAVGGQPPASCALAIVAHHSLLDGLHGMKLFTNLLDGAERRSNMRGSTATDFPNDRETKVPAFNAGCARFVAGEMLRRSAKSILASDASASATRTTLAFEWSRKLFRTAQQRGKSTFQEILLTVITDALARYSRSHGQNRNLRAIVPLARCENHPSSHNTNQHDIGYIKLPITSEHCDRVQEIRTSLRSLRQQQKLQFFPSLLGFIGRLPKVLRTFVARRFAYQADLLISLIPGGRTKQTLDGAEVLSIFAQPALPPRHSIVVGITLSRCSVCVTLQLDAKQIDDPENLRSCFELAYRGTIFESASTGSVPCTNIVPNTNPIKGSKYDLHEQPLGSVS